MEITKPTKVGMPVMFKSDYTKHHLDAALPNDLIGEVIELKPYAEYLLKTQALVAWQTGKETLEDVDELVVLP